VTVDHYFKLTCLSVIKFMNADVSASGKFLSTQLSSKRVGCYVLYSDVDRSLECGHFEIALWIIVCPDLNFLDKALFKIFCVKRDLSVGKRKVFVTHFYVSLYLKCILV